MRRVVTGACGAPSPRNVAVVAKKTSALYASLRGLPTPGANLRQVLTALADVTSMLLELGVRALTCSGTGRAQLGNEIHHGLHQMKAIQVVEHGHVEGRGGGAFLLIAAD